MGDQGRRHPHIRAAVAAQELDAARLEFEMLVPEHFREGVAAAFRPLGIVVARHDPPGPFQFIHQPLGESDLLVGAEFGDIAAEHRELDVRLAVDILNAALQVLDPRRAGADVDIRQEGELDGPVLRMRRQERQQ